jgi:hypothetical protein
MEISNISHNMRKTNKRRYIAWYSWVNILIVIAGAWSSYEGWR